jgi:hypothetical protein
LPLDEAATLFLDGEPATARVILRAQKTDKPSMDNLAAIFDVLRGSLGVEIEVRAA